MQHNRHHTVFGIANSALQATRAKGHTTGWKQNTEISVAAVDGCEMNPFYIALLLSMRHLSLQTPQIAAVQTPDKQRADSKQETKPIRSR